ncbi:MAG TPA: hypothetical protein VMR65_03940 [Candidatus Sulfotelmatobacter sp.]|jgi:5-methyltetrahydropteroyltriglutamate--homocysteine methyltransferase|nr:hypothetical protein [Candidatus Sulfotelmatobacter sp.]
MALLTTTIGSFPQPAALQEARRQFNEGEIDAGMLRAAEEDAARRAIAQQEEAGIHLFVDGEMERVDPVAGFAERLGGIEIAGWVRVVGDRYVRKPRIVGPIVRAGGTAADRWRFASGLTGTAVKAVLPGPYTLMDSSFDEHYGSRRKACEAFVEIVRAEVADLVTAGAAEIQIDEPAAGAVPAELPLLAEALESVLSPAAGRARTWVYLGYADLERDGAALASLPADGLLVAAAHSEGAGLESLAVALPAGRFLGVGVVDTLETRVEAVEQVSERLRRAAALIASDRLWAVPDGGFRGLPESVVRAKLAVLVNAARAFGSGRS